MTKKNNLKLVYVKKVGTNDDGTYEYDLLFSENPEIVWGVDWDYNNPSICNDLTPEKDTYSDTVRIRTAIPLKTIEETSCYSMEYSIYGITALSWIDINKLEEYPEKGRMVFKFGDSKKYVMDEIKSRDITVV